jgi:GGDEF domain-containing protein
MTLCYQAAVEDAKQHAIDFGAITAPYRASLDAILGSMATVEWSDTHLDYFRVALQTSFRSYKEVAEKQLFRLRTDLEQTTVSLSAVLKSLEYDEPARSLRTQVAGIEDLQKIDDLELLKSRLGAALVELEKGLDEMEKRNHLAISDLQAEVSMLYDRVAVLATPKLSERNLRVIVDERLSGAPFTLLIVRLAGLSRIQARYGDEAIAAVLISAQQRLEGALELVQAIGVWDERTLGALLDQTDATAAALTRSATNALSGKYDVGGEEVTLQANAGVLEWRPPGETARFLRRLQDLLHVLRT